MAALRKATAYSKRPVVPYTRTSKKKRKAYIKMIPPQKIVKFTMGREDLQRNGKLPYVLTLISDEKAQIRHNSLEACRQYINKKLATELNDQFVKKMLEIVRNNISNAGFNKDDFASAMNVSPSLLYKKTKLLTNQSPTDFIKIVRLDHASDLLQMKKYSVTEISELCGFSSVGYFSKVFKKHFGKSPTDV